MCQHQSFAVSVEGAGEVIVQSMFAEVFHYRPMRPPTKGLGKFEPIAIQWLEFDDADVVESYEILDALRRC